DAEDGQTCSRGPARSRGRRARVRRVEAVIVPGRRGALARAMCGRARPAIWKERPEDGGEQIVEKEVDERGHADVLARAIVHWDDRLDPDLHEPPGPDDTGVDRPGGLLLVGPLQG